MIIKEGHVMHNPIDKNFQRKQTDINDFRKEILEALPLNLREILKSFLNHIKRYGRNSVKSESTTHLYARKGKIFL